MVVKITDFRSQIRYLEQRIAGIHTELPNADSKERQLHLLEELDQCKKELVAVWNDRNLDQGVIPKRRRLVLPL